jgi:hypothetical protein
MGLPKKLTVLALLLTFFISNYAQISISADKKYLQENGKSGFINGVNYTPSAGWFQILDNWNTSVIEKDMDSLRSIGVDFIRFMPLWYLMQPEKDRLDKQKIDHLIELVNIAGKRGILVQPSLITGWLSGGIFNPYWVTKEMFVDQEQINAETWYVKNVAKSLKNNPYIHSYDFGNEINALKEVGGYEGTPLQTKYWMAEIYKAFKSGDPDRLVTNGIGTGYDANFPVENIVLASDYMSAHSYAFFHATILDDPWFGLRTTYSTNLMIAWAKMAGKPVLMQEIGVSDEWMGQDKRAEYLEMNYFSCWADGAAGFVWWCSHDIDTAFRIMPDKKGREMKAGGTFDPLEYQMGLLDVNNNKHPVAEKFKQCAAFSESLGLNWIDLLPVCYIVAPETVSLNLYFRNIINAYVLAKQNHIDVRFLRENSDVPADASFVIIPGFSLKSEAKLKINKYLENGGTVYQSVYNNFASNINVDPELNFQVGEADEILVSKRMANFNLLEKLPMSGHLKMTHMNSSHNYETILKLCPDCINHSLNDKGEGVYFKTKVGNGNYYYTRLNVEESFCDTYNPWENDESYNFYSVLKPEQDIDIDSKFVEFYHKRNEKTEVIVLINHTDFYRETNFFSRSPVSFRNLRSNEKLACSVEFNLKLRPSEVVFLEVQR